MLMRSQLQKLTLLSHVQRGLCVLDRCACALEFLSLHYRKPIGAIPRLTILASRIAFCKNIHTHGVPLQLAQRGKVASLAESPVSVGITRFHQSYISRTLVVRLGLSLAWGQLSTRGTGKGRAKRQAREALTNQKHNLAKTLSFSPSFQFPFVLHLLPCKSSRRRICHTLAPLASCNWLGECDLRWREGRAAELSGSETRGRQEHMQQAPPRCCCCCCTWRTLGHVAKHGPRRTEWCNLEAQRGAEGEQPARESSAALAACGGGGGRGGDDVAWNAHAQVHEAQDQGEQNRNGKEAILVLSVGAQHSLAKHLRQPRRRRRRRRRERFQSAVFGALDAVRRSLCQTFQ